METLTIEIGLIEQNTGQIPGVPANPRTISDERLDALKRSIQDLPDMLSMRELLVYPLDGKYIVLGGNMRLRACIELGYTEMPCKVIPPSTPAEKLRAIIMQDNNEYGEMEWDMVASDWDADELKDWGVELPEEWELSPENCPDTFSLPDGNKPNSQVISFTLSGEQAENVHAAIDMIKSEGLSCETFGNTNTNGNALYQIIKEWEGQRK